MAAVGVTTAAAVRPEHVAVPPAEYTLSMDTLTDGIENCSSSSSSSSSGCCSSSHQDHHHPTLFLSLWKNAYPMPFVQDNFDTATRPLARYCLSDLAGDLLSRAAADQRYTLGHVRAVFLPGPPPPPAASLSLSSSSISSSLPLLWSLSSLPGLLYASADASLTIVHAAPHHHSRTTSTSSSSSSSTTGNTMHHTHHGTIAGLVDLVHGSHAHPQVKVCPIPAPTPRAATPPVWWRVYEDAHVMVHACRTLGGHTRDTEDDTAALAYVVSLQTLLPRHPPRAGQPPPRNSLLLLSGTITRHVVNDVTAVDRTGRDDDNDPPQDPPPRWPILHHHHDDHHGGVAARIFCTIVLPTGSCPSVPKDWIVLTTTTTRVDHGSRPEGGSGLLVRAQRQTRQWRHHCTPILRPYFPWNHHTQHDTEDDGDFDDGDGDFGDGSGSSILDGAPRSNDDGAAADVRRQPPQSRLSSRKNRPALDGTTPLPPEVVRRVQDRTRIRLRTGTSIVIPVRITSTATHPVNDDSSGTVAAPDTRTEDCYEIDRILCRDSQPPRPQRRRSIGSAVLAQNSFSHPSKDDATAEDDPQTSDSNDRNSWPNRMTDFLTFSSLNGHVDDELAHDQEDEDEIDISEFDDDDDDHHVEKVEELEQSHPRHCLADESSSTVSTAPHLLVFGTGCASPSPYRGASGYALVLPSQEKTKVIVLEAGEGFCTQWNRHAPTDLSLTFVRAIWISHAHWDHYGGLVCLLIRIKQAHDEKRNHTPAIPRWEAGQPDPKRRCPERLSLLSDPPWLVVPPKVSRYLKCVFDEPSLYFREVFHDNSNQMEQMCTDINRNPRPDEFEAKIAFWENVPVDHSCRAYGLVLGLELTSKATSPYLFGFSGDTRPDLRLVRACCKFSHMYKRRFDFLLHEATFGANEEEMSLAKKHSTTEQAITIGRKVDARRLLLTHFSQRYDDVPNIAEESARFNKRMLVGFALDGMLVSL